ncbi:12930_t:CDS:1, partial [Racocetra fulgida]
SNYIPLPSDIILKSDCSQGLISFVYPKLQIQFQDTAYLTERVILALRNKEVNALNAE